MDRISNGKKLDSFSYNIKYYLPLLICCFLMVACSDDSNNDDDKIGGSTTTTRTTSTTTPTTPVDPPTGNMTCAEAAEREIAGQPGLNAHQGNACIDDDDSYIIDIIEASQISDSENGVCCTKRCIEPGVEAITSGVQSTHSCFIVGEEAYLQCYGGDNTHGQLGNGCFDNRRNNRLHLNYVVAKGVEECYRDQFVPEDKRLKGVKRVVAGMTHTCALLKDGDLLCWGANDQGQLGREGARSASPVSVVLPEGKTDLEGDKVIVQDISAGDFHTCLVAKKGDERIFCWGQNDVGQAGKPFQVSIEDGIINWSYDTNTIVSEPDLIAIATPRKDYGDGNDSANFKCNGSDSAITCHELESDNYVPICTGINNEDRKYFPICDGGGVPVCGRDGKNENGNGQNLPSSRSIICPTEEVINTEDDGESRLSDSELAGQLNFRIEAETITEDCSAMKAEVEGEGEEEKIKKPYNLGFFDCKLGMDNQEAKGERNFTITSTRDKFWEEEEEREYDLPRIPPNFNCEEFYNVEYAKTGDESGNAYKDILCDLSSTTDVDANRESKILSLQEECKVIKSRWARILERLYIRLNFNIAEDENFIETYKYVSAGADHTCTVNSEDEVLCFGDNSEDQLGQQKFNLNADNDHDPNNDDSDDKQCTNIADLNNFSKYPLQVKDSIKGTKHDEKISGVRQIVVGVDFNCAKITQQVDTGPQVKCWGRGFSSTQDDNERDESCYPYIQTQVRECNGRDTLADTSSSSSLPLADVETITAGRAHACGVRKCEGTSKREVVCWGDDSRGQLGRGGTVREHSDEARPVIVSFDSGQADKHIPLTTDEAHQESLNANKDLTCITVPASDDQDEGVLCWGRYQSPLDDERIEIVLPERLSLQCEARGNDDQETAGNFLK